MKRRTREFKLFFCIFLAVLMVVGGVGLQAQEYDDMYFSSSDRQAVASEAKLSSEPTPLAATKYSVQGDYDYSEDSYSAKTVNPEYIAKYTSNETISAKQPESGYGNDDYFIPEEKELVDPADAYAQKIYGDNGNAYPVNRYSTFSSPFYSPYRGSTFGRYSPYSRYSMYSPYSMYSRYSPYSRYSAIYDPFYDPYFDSFAYGAPGGYYSPYGGSGFRTSVGLGFGSSFGGGGYYCPSPYSGAYGRGFVNGYSAGTTESVATAVPARDVTQGARRTRTAVVNRPTTDTPSGLSRTRRNAQTSGVITENAPASGRISEDNRDFSSTQNEYLRASRSNSSRVGRSANRNLSASNLSRSEYVPRTRSTVGTSSLTRSSSGARTGLSNSSRSSDLRRSYNTARPSVTRSSYQRSSSSGSSSRPSRSFSGFSPSRSSSSSSGVLRSGSSSSGGRSISAPSRSSSSGRSFSGGSSGATRSRR